MLGSVAGTLTMAVSQGFLLSAPLDGIEGSRTLMIAMLKMLGGIRVARRRSATVVWYGLDQALGRSLIGQIVCVGAGISAGIAVYVRLVLTMRVEEAHQIRNLLLRAPASNALRLASEA